MKVPCKNIPTYDYDKQEWSTTSFADQLEFGNFLMENCFKDAGEYKFDERVFKWNENGRNFTKEKRYINHAFGTKEYFDFWDNEEMKSRLGVIWKAKDVIWYTTRDYYFLLNYCPIINKEKGYIETFADIRDVQYHMMMYEKLAEIFHQHSAILKRRQMLFEQPHSSLILAKDGWTTMGEVEIGDEIRNPDGDVCKVVDKSNNGIKQIYKVVLDDDTEIECGEFHLWEVYKNGSKKPIVTTTKELINSGLYKEYLSRGKTRKEYKYRINNIQAIKYEKQNLPIHPYVLGVLLGDGSFSGSQVGFTTYDEDIANRVFDLLGSEYEEGYTRAADDIKISYNINYKNRFDEKNSHYENSQYGCNPLLRELDRLKLKGLTGRYKFIPEEYKYSSIEDRISLIQGLMDSDGFINEVGRDLNFTTTSKLLANDVWIVLKELGLSSSISTKENEHGLFYRVRISGNISIPLFYTFRKKKRLELRNKEGKRKSFKSNRRIVDIIKLDKFEECSCIMVDHSNHLYITNGYTITHNSFCHVAKTVNYLWFENKKRIKWFASDEGFLDDVNGSWSIFDQYVGHLNKHSDWYRALSGSYPEVQQKQQVKINGKWEWEGSESTVISRTLKKDPKLGVGGPTFWAWHEEGGIAPKADITLQYMDPALVSGLIRVGSFCIGGSVGDLSECKPLENFIKNPSNYGFFKVPTKWWDDSRSLKECGLFIPAQYGMPEATDEYGNSNVELALQLLHKAEFEGFKAGEYGKIADEQPWISLPPQDYVLKKSQSPKTIKEAFAWRKVSYFNVQRIERRQKAIEILNERNEIVSEKGLLYEQDGEIKLKHLDSFDPNERPTEMIYPVDPKIRDKRGVVTIYEWPMQNADSNLYFAGVDSVEVGITETSESLFSVDIYKRGHKLITYKADGSEQIEHKRGRIVATYRGRFDNPDDHNEQGLLLLRLYKALAGCERNKPNFINYARRKGHSTLIARRSAFPLDKDLDVIGGKNDEYGVWNDSAGKLLKTFKQTVYEYIDQEIDTIHKKTNNDTVGDIIKTIRGYDLIDDYWLLEELKLYNEDGNFDRFISCALSLLLGISRELDYEKSTIVYEETETKNKKPIPKKPQSLLKPIKPLNKNLLKY